MPPDDPKSHQVDPDGHIFRPKFFVGIFGESCQPAWPLWGSLGSQVGPFGGTLEVKWDALVETWGQVHHCGAALGAKWVTCGSVLVNFARFAGSLGSLVLAGSRFGGSHLVCLFAFM